MQLLTQVLRAATAIYYAVRGLDNIYSVERSRGEITFTVNGTAVWDYSSRSRLQRSIELNVNNATFAARMEDLLISGN
jgi:hypothetical protein